MHFQFSSFIVLLAAAVSACPSHEDLNIVAPFDPLNPVHAPRGLNEHHKRAAATEPRDWHYTNSSTWGDIKPGK
jgi:hypothetical protein